MSNSSIYPGSPDGENPGDLVFLTGDEPVTDNDTDDVPGTATPTGNDLRTSALPVVVEGEDIDDFGDDDIDYRRDAIDLDDLGSSSPGRPALDLSSLIGQFGQRTRKPQSAPMPQAAVSKPADVQPATAPGMIAPPTPQEQVARLTTELAQEKNLHLRAKADLINYRRKAENDRERATHDAIERFAKKLLEVTDDFYRSVATTSELKSYDQLAEGVQAILRNYATMLKTYGIAEIETVGKIFDVELHESVAVDTASDLPEDTIVEELRKGYTVDGRLLRAAMVKVVRKTGATAEQVVEIESDQSSDNAEPETEFDAPATIDLDAEVPAQ